ncbi:5-bromo-4-chloroindolyl phosphate hydrolysis family protein [Niallia nealsonii]|uniref:Protein xpaC n=1 Tax=Niallia nealsonii TaxID=115979 RepID=A0A2N0Z0P7_9BACI|nr:5-bromo-4-chloroindolyl phosphate hydrolysis family protein [Niallia nealsonii]PKG23068.1 protein xpaC [Niallia nealsonii]
MNPFLKFLVRSGVTIPIGALTWFSSLLILEQSFIASVIYGVLAGTGTYFISDGVMQHQFLKKHGLTRKEFKFINKHLKEAKTKIHRLNKAVFAIRHFPSIKQRIDLMRVTKKVYRLTQQEPKRFYRADKFYYSHLDSVMEIAEKYALLSSQPKKNHELQSTLRQTRAALEQLTKTIEQDLHEILTDDIDDLHFELEVVKHTSQKNKDDELIDESRRLK